MKPIPSRKSILGATAYFATSSFPTVARDAVGGVTLFQNLEQECHRERDQERTGLTKPTRHSLHTKSIKSVPERPWWSRLAGAAGRRTAHNDFLPGLAIRRAAG